MKQFKEAAARLAAKREAEQLSADERIAKRLRTYMQQWKADLDQRPASAVNTTMGLQVSLGTCSASVGVSITPLR